MDESPAQDDRDENTLNRSVRFCVCPTHTLLWMLGVLTALVALSGVGRILLWFSISHDSHFRPLILMFDVNWEGTIPSYLSSIMLLLCSLKSFYIASFAEGRCYWKLLGAGFAFLSVDEMIEIHNRLNGPIKEMGATGIFEYAWVIPAILVLSLLAVLFIPFVRKLDGETRLLFIGAAAIYVLGAVGFEMAAGYVYHNFQEGTFKRYALDGLTEHAEEWLEMVGVVLFLYALATFIEKHRGSISFIVWFQMPGSAAHGTRYPDQNGP